MIRPTIVFFGSFGIYSAIVLEKLLANDAIEVIQVITTPPFTNRKGQTEKSAVHILAQSRGLNILTELPKKIAAADFIITAGYGKLLPVNLLSQPKIGSLNLHFSLLPKYRGANPAEWALLLGETESGVTVIEMNEEFDQGGILSQAKIEIAKNETRLSLYQKLYNLGGDVLPQTILGVAEGKLKPQPQPDTDLPYASRFYKQDGFVSWLGLEKLMLGQTTDLDQVSEKLANAANLSGLGKINVRFIERATRALFEFPSLWTIIPTAKGEKRMKILSTQIEQDKLVLKEVQIEGKNNALWSEAKNVIKN